MNENRGSFDRLVSGISASERRNLLEKMQGVAADRESDPLEQTALESAQAFAEGTGSLASQLKKKSLVFRLLLWVQSLFSNTSVETLFNEHLISQLAHAVEKKYPGIIDQKRGYLLSPLFDSYIFCAGQG